MTKGVDRRVRSGRRGGAGIFLLIVLIAVALMFALMFMPGGSAEQAVETRDRAQEFSIDIQARQMAIQIAAFRMANQGRDPADLDELTGGASSSYTDPWGTELQFAVRDEGRGPGVVVVESAGPDGEFGTEDDLVSEQRLSL